MPSFDIVSQVDMQEVDNAINQTAKEITTRYDFRNSKSKVERDKNEVTITADDDYKLEQVLEVIKTKFVRRKIDPQSLSYGKVEKAAGSMVRQVITVRQGVESELAKKIIKDIKDSKIKVQAAIQEDQVRVTGKNRDDLQAVIALVREKDYDLPLQFINFRE